MVRPKDNDGIKSFLIVTEVEKRPCLFDTNHSDYGDRAEKARCWDEVCDSVVPEWRALGQAERLAAGMLRYPYTCGRRRAARPACGRTALHNRSDCNCRARGRLAYSLFRRLSKFKI
ncbi:hypothetical protein RR46_01452 [Papilio xuthus]|uniref:MADF domain-containing protein n=1 Tax=Papilio xuthus TaxID=66420 RepID=A0A0N1IN35_PAPXU|nr:hypothetical protein RR46_01452 [Papilio xuthus]